MDAEIVKRDGKTVRLSDYGVQVKDFIVSSLSLETEYDNIDGLHGKIDMGSTYKERKISVPCFLEINKLNEFVPKREELFDVLSDTESYYIRELRKDEEDQYQYADTKSQSSSKTNENKYVNDKRYLVRLAENITMEQSKLNINFTLEFETTALPFAESTKTTLDYHTGNGWTTTYIFEDIKTSNVWNAGNIANDQANMERRVKLTLNENMSSLAWNCGDVKNISITGIALKKGDIILYDGINILRNGNSILNNTNYVFPEFKVGQNTIIFAGTAPKLKAEIDFRYYYK